MNRVRAIIIANQQVLLIKRTKPNEAYWVLPGGGVEKGETQEVALKREIKEELGVDINILSLVLERDSDMPGMEGVREYFLMTEIIGGELGTGRGPEYQSDTHYVGKYTPQWIDISKLHDIDVRPKDVKEVISEVPPLIRH